MKCEHGKDIKIQVCVDDYGNSVISVDIVGCIECEFDSYNDFQVIHTNSDKANKGDIKYERI